MSLLQEIYATHLQGLFSCALAITRNRADAEDAVQDAMIRLSKSGFGDASQPLAYTYRAVRNSALDRLRRLKSQSRTRDRLFDDDSALPASAQPPDGLISAERHRELALAVESLDDELREIVVLKNISGLTYAQIADMLQAPLTTIASRHTRALKLLRQQLQEAIV